MATTQYIGARYVPVFAEPVEWDNTRTYDSLTMVMNQGNTYITKQYVPVGVELTDEKFWIRISDFNAQLEQYRQEVRGFDTRIDANKAAVESEKSERETADTTLSGQIDLVRDDMSKAVSTETDERIDADDALENKINSNSDKISTLEFSTHQPMLYDRANYAPNKLVEIAETYAQNNDKIYYGFNGALSFLAQTLTESGWAPSNFEGRASGGNYTFPMSCSTLVNAAIMSIPYNNSRMANGTAVMSSSGGIVHVEGGTNKNTGGNSMSAQLNGSMAKKYGSAQGTLHSWQMAEYFDNIGILKEIDDLSQLKTGDILFYQNWTDPTVPHYKNINHVDIFIGWSGYNMVVISMETDGCHYVGRAPSTGMYQQMKFTATIPSVGIPPKEIIHADNIEFTSAGFKTFRISDGQLTKNKSYTVVYEIDEIPSALKQMHINGFGVDAAGKADTTSVGHLEFNNSFAQIGANKYAIVFRNLNDTNNGITINIPNFPSGNTLSIKSISMYNGVIAV